MENGKKILQFLLELGGILNNRRFKWWGRGVENKTMTEKEKYTKFLIIRFEIIDFNKSLLPR